MNNRVFAAAVSLALSVLVAEAFGLTVFGIGSQSKEERVAEATRRVDDANDAFYASIENLSSARSDLLELIGSCRDTNDLERCRFEYNRAKEADEYLKAQMRIYRDVVMKSTAASQPKTLKATANVDPQLEALRARAVAAKGRLEVIKRMKKAQNPTVTNLTARVAKQSVMEKLTELRTQYLSATNRAEIAERHAAAFSNSLYRVTSFLEEKRDEARLSTTKSIYQAIIDKIEEVKAGE